MKPCPICGVDCHQLGARGNQVVCPACEKRAVDSTGRPISIGEQFSETENVITMGGPAAYFKEPDPQAGEICEEATENLTCWIDGKEVKIFEGAFGWIGLIVPREPLL